MLVFHFSVFRREDAIAIGIKRVAKANGQKSPKCSCWKEPERANRPIKSQKSKAREKHGPAGRRRYGVLRYCQFGGDGGKMARGRFFTACEQRTGLRPVPAIKDES